jgi:hypothetical protein
VETGFIAALAAALALGFVEGLGRFYPSRTTWRRLRRARGRLAMVKMRERFEASAARRSPRILALVLLVLMVAWIGASSLLDKRWHEVLTDVIPYVIVSFALFRIPPAMRAIGERMKEYEHEVGDDQISDDDSWPGDGGVATL